MRKTIKTILILSVGVAFTSLAISCKKNNTGKGGNAPEGTITFKVDGDKVTTLEMTSIASIQNQVLHLQGNTGGTEAKAVAFVIFGYNGVGTYSFSGNIANPNTAEYVVTKVNMSNPSASETKAWVSTGMIGNAGDEISISEVTSTHIKGSFHFKGKNANDNSEKEITEGSFNVKLQ